MRIFSFSTNCLCNFKLSSDKKEKFYTISYTVVKLIEQNTSNIILMLISLVYKLFIGKHCKGVEKSGSLCQHKLIIDGNFYIILSRLNVNSCRSFRHFSGKKAVKSL